MSTMRSALGDAVGSWSGANAFRLMPEDAVHESNATAHVTLAAHGNLVSIAYTWGHAADGQQDGLLVLGATDDGEEAIALWADSWHQHPAPRMCAGMLGDGMAEVEYEYHQGWSWRIVVDASARDCLRLRMYNIAPADADVEASAPYEAMAMELARSG